MQTIIWGRLCRTGGSDESPIVPNNIPLSEIPSYVGRTNQPGPTVGDSGVIQSVIPCLFISSTHFSIKVIKGESDRTYKLNDFSKNGTFLNGTAIKGETEIKHGDEVSLRYKNVERLIYKFEACEGTMDEADRQHNIAPMRIDHETQDVFEHQIEALRAENISSEARIAAKTTELETVARDLDLANRKIRSNETQLASKDKELSEKDKELVGKDKELSELKDKMRETEDNLHAVEARNCKIEVLVIKNHWMML